jgi:NADH:ubiquinone oxidoreductase subunit 5 (subunit L)/multisubunit Na+/H+ antiporter MnhA subunit
MLVNRVGDVGLALAICIVFLTFKTVDYSVTFALVPSVISQTFSLFCFDCDVITILSLFLF